MTIDERTRQLTALTAERGLIEAIRQTYGGAVQVQIGFSDADCELRIEEINFSVRALNALRRAGIFTLGALIDAAAAGTLPSLRNLGQKSVHEIQTRLLAFGFERLRPSEQQQFLADLAARNP